MGKGIAFALLACTALAGTLVIGGCDNGADEAAAKAAAEARARAFAASEKPWRDARAAELVAPEGWTTVVGLHWIDKGSHYAGTAASNGIRLAMGPAHFGMLDLGADGHVRFTPDKDVAFTLNGAPLTGAVVLKADADEGGPDKLGFDDGKGVATIIKRGDRVALRVRHADAEARRTFAGIQYWPGGPEWKVAGRYIPHPAGTTVKIANIINMVEEVPNPGAVEFTRDGKTHRLEAIDEGEPTLFLIYADRTSGHGSYPAGRYLDIARPGADGKVVLDFNRGENPPCAFTAFATCPLPPAANRLDLAVEAGERAYAKH